MVEREWCCDGCAAIGPIWCAVHWLTGCYQGVEALPLLLRVFWQGCTCVMIRVQQWWLLYWRILCSLVETFLHWRWSCALCARYSDGTWVAVVLSMQVRIFRSVEVRSWCSCRSVVVLVRLWQRDNCFVISFQLL